MPVKFKLMNENNKKYISLQRQFELLRVEYENEKQSYISASKNIIPGKNLTTEKCWYPISINRGFYNSINQYVIEIFREESEIESSDFEPGRSVCFFEIKHNEKCFLDNIIGTISIIDENRMLIAVQSESAKTTLKNIDSVGVQLYFDETSYKAMFDALTKVMFAKNNRLADLRDIICGTKIPEFREIYPIRFPWLNNSQQNAVLKVLGTKDVSVVHGPPGTGKTTTLVEAIYETLRREEQVLVCAQSNAAVDWIAEKLIERGVNVLRIGNPLRVSDALLSSTYERRYEAHPEYSELWGLRKSLRELYAQNNKNRGNESFKNQISKIKNRITEIEISIDAQIFNEAKVVASTLVGSSGRVMERKHFNTLFIDEAGQALEAACWIPIPMVKRVILAGDHCQLPPTIKSAEAMSGGLDITMMQKVAETKPSAVSFLNVQYRMNKDIMQFSSDWFYDGVLNAAPEVAERLIHPLDYPIVWYNTNNLDFKESMNDITLSKINKDEANLLIKTLEEYVLNIGIDKIKDERIDFGIISPYKNQVYYLRHLLKSNKLIRQIRKFITVNSIDSFQGQEKDVIMISMVRGNNEGKIGFLKDLRRMNVAITRAKMKLIIIGNSDTLSVNRFYRKLYEYIDKNGKVINLNPEIEVKEEN